MSCLCFFAPHSLARDLFAPPGRRHGTIEITYTTSTVADPSVPWNFHVRRFVWRFSPLYPFWVVFVLSYRFVGVNTTGGPLMKWIFLSFACAGPDLRLGHLFSFSFTFLVFKSSCVQINYLY